MLEVGLDLVLVAGVGVDHVPLLRGALGGIRIVRLRRLAGEARGLARLVARLGLGDLLVVHFSTWPSASRKSVSSTAM